MEELIGKDFAPGTYECYQTALCHIQNFILWKYKVPDVDSRPIEFEFLTDFEYYLKVVKKCSHNTAIKYITNFRKIIKIRIHNGWIDKDPFANDKVTLREVKRVCLSQTELQTLASKTFASSRLDTVGDSLKKHAENRIKTMYIVRRF